MAIELEAPLTSLISLHIPDLWRSRITLLQDLSLLDHIEGLITPMDKMEKSMEESESFNGELALLIEAVAHIEEQIKRRESLMGGEFKLLRQPSEFQVLSFPPPSSTG